MRVTITVMFVLNLVEIAVEKEDQVEVTKVVETDVRLAVESVRVLETVPTEEEIEVVTEVTADLANVEVLARENADHIAIVQMETLRESEEAIATVLIKVVMPKAIAIPENVNQVVIVQKKRLQRTQEMNQQVEIEKVIFPAKDALENSSKFFK